MTTTSDYGDGGPVSGDEGEVAEEEVKVLASDIYGLEHLVRLIIALPGMMGPVSSIQAGSLTSMKVTGILM